MKTYFAWSLRQLYLLFFYPTQFGREVEDYPLRRQKLTEGQRFHYLMKMLPWLVVLAALGNLVAGQSCQAFGIDFLWAKSWAGVAVGVAFGVWGGVAFSVAVGVAGGVTGGVAGGVAFGVAGGGAVGVAVGVAGSVAVGVAFGVVFGVAGGVAGGLLFGVVFGVAGGVAYGVAVGVAAGVACPLAFWGIYFRLAAYPVDVALAGLCYYAGRRWPQSLPRVWKWCPVAWNEVIWLPLPYVAKLLALLARQNREEGFRAIAFVAAERQLQLPTALAALTGVAIDDLEIKSVTEIAAVSDNIQWTTLIHTALPAELVAAFLCFDRTAQHIEQYLTLHSPYRQGEVLERALTEVEALQRSLIAARGRQVARLLKVANDWRGVLEAEREDLRDRVKLTRGIENPFLMGVPITEQDANVFAGRQDLVRQIEESVLGATRAPTLLLHGPRRMGKTSILYQLPRLLGPDFAPTFVDCQDPAVRSSPADLLGYLARSLTESLQRRHVDVPPTPSFEALDRTPYPTFRKWLDETQRRLPAGMRVLLCLDEYDRLPALAEVTWVKDFLDFLRHLIQHHPRVVVLFTGVHTFAEQGPAWTDRFLNARRMRVSFLRRDDVIPLLTRPIPTFDLTYAPGALEAVLDATNGQPYLTQAVAFELVQLLNEQRRKEATPADVEVAIACTLVNGGEYFANVWFDAGAEGQAVLLALARGEALPDIPRARAWLRDHDILDDAGRFAVPLVERWVRKEKLVLPAAPALGGRDGLPASLDKMRP